MPLFTRLFHYCVALLSLPWIVAGFAYAAQPLEEKTISEIAITGNRAVPTQDILSQMKVRKGDKVGDVRLLADRDLKALWKTGKFQDVQMSLQPLSDDTMRLIVFVREKPVLRAIHMDGNLSLSSGELQDKSGLRIGAPYDEFSAEEAAQKIRAYYKEKEFFQAEVTPAAEVKDGDVSLTFKIKEGMKVKVVKITIAGNQAFSEGKIKGFMDTKEAGWFIGGTYKEDTFKEDLKKILVGYAREGYLKAKIYGYNLQDIDAHFPDILAKALSVDQTKKEMTIRLVVEEGIQYRLNSIAIKGNIIYSEEELLGRMELKPGAIFNRVAFENDLQQIRMAYAEKGYIFADINPEMEYHDDSGKVDVTIWIKENTIARIEKIEIRGNALTKDKVIRRELTIKPGEPFDTRQIQKSREKIMNLGFFQDVKITTEPGSTPNEQVLVLEVDERQTGTISLGAGYSSVDKLMGYLQLSENNLFGNGQSVSLQWEMGTLRQSWQMSFTEPWLFDAPVSFGVDVWNITKNKGYNGQEYNLLSQGGDIRLGRRFDETWTGYLTYKLESENYSDLDSSLIGTYQPGRTDTSSVTPTLIYDTRDNIFDATTGTNQRFSIEIAGGPLGGDNNYLRYTYDGSYYVPLIWRLVLALHGQAGYAYGYDYGVSGYTDVPPAKRYLVGGTDTVRGYREGVLRPEDQPLGGRMKLIANAELHFPIVGPLKGVAFFDAGNSWKDAGSFLDYAFLYKGVGAGIRLTIPGTVILVRFDLGYPLDTDPENNPRTLQYHFNIGNIF